MNSFDIEGFSQTFAAMTGQMFKSSSFLLSVVVEATSVVKAEVESENIRFFGTGRVVMLHFSAGYSMPLTEKCTLGDGRYIQIFHGYPVIMCTEL